ncbi:MAG: adenylyltransferase/cytidyltransferase family protein [bacterium]
MKQRIAIYPTSANPPTLGHADILIRTSRYFDYVYWAAAINPEKTYSFTEEQRLLMMSEYIQHHQLKNVSAEAFNGSTVRYAQERDACAIVKGLRSLEDFEGGISASCRKYRNRSEYRDFLPFWKTRAVCSQFYAGPGTGIARRKD